MYGIINLESFIIASILLNLTPGVDTIYILTKSASGGKKQGIASALGISSGILVHTVLVSLGLSAILATSAIAFTALKVVGAGYLVFMGIRSIMKKESIFEAKSSGSDNILKNYLQGVLTNVLNPKVALFFLALLPIYVDSSNSFGPLPFMILGLVFVCTSTIWTILIAFVSSFLSRHLNNNEKISKITNKVTGCIYIGLGLNIL